MCVFANDSTLLILPVSGFSSIHFAYFLFIKFRTGSLELCPRALVDYLAACLTKLSGHGLVRQQKK